MLAFMSFPKDHRPKIHSINPSNWSASSRTKGPSCASSARSTQVQILVPLEGKR